MWDSSSQHLWVHMLVIVSGFTVWAQRCLIQEHLPSVHQCQIWPLVPWQPFTYSWPREPVYSETSRRWCPIILFSVYLLSHSSLRITLIAFYTVLYNIVHNSTYVGTPISLVYLPIDGHFKLFTFGSCYEQCSYQYLCIRFFFFFKGLWGHNSGDSIWVKT